MRGMTNATQKQPKKTARSDLPNPSVRPPEIPRLLILIFMLLIIVVTGAQRAKRLSQLDPGCCVCSFVSVLKDPRSCSLRVGFLLSTIQRPMFSMSLQSHYICRTLAFIWMFSRLLTKRGNHAGLWGPEHDTNSGFCLRCQRQAGNSKVSCPWPVPIHEFAGPACTIMLTQLVGHNVRGLSWWTSWFSCALCPLLFGEIRDSSCHGRF